MNSIDTESKKFKTTAHKAVEERREAARKKWDAMEKLWKLPPAAFEHAVKELRKELEQMRDMVEKLPFSLPAHGDMPMKLAESCFDHNIGLVRNLNPSIMPSVEAIEQLAEDCGISELIDFDAILLNLQMTIADTGFQIGVLAGFMFAGADEKQIDRLAHGLTLTLQHSDWICTRDNKTDD